MRRKLITPTRRHGSSNIHWHWQRQRQRWTRRAVQRCPGRGHRGQPRFPEGTGRCWPAKGRWTKYKAIYPNATEQTRMMAAYIYFVLHEQITSLKPSQTGCATEFRCGTIPFKRLITGKKQPGGPGRSSEVRGGSSRKLEEVAEMEGVTPAKQKENDQVNNSSQVSSTSENWQRQRQRSPREKKVGGWGKSSKQVGRTVRLEVRIRRLSKILKMVKAGSRFQESRWPSTVHSVYTFSFVSENFHYSVVTLDCSYYFRSFTFSYFIPEKLCS